MKAPHNGLISQTPVPPYYAVIFSSVRTPIDEGYSETAKLMLELAAEIDGFLGIESARNELGITVSYWRDLNAIARWRKQTDHQLAQQYGREKWYSAYKTRIALVERDYGFSR
ncbi:MAG: antibiotic biosynthesis monooxygenase family protein [Mangrovibacterium sp.]